MNVDYKLIGQRIKCARKRTGMTQEVLAERLDVSIGYVSQVERGITKISLDLLAAISSILGCDIASLVSESATTSTNYISNDIKEKLYELDGKKRKVALEIIELLSQL